MPGVCGRHGDVMLRTVSLTKRNKASASTINNLIKRVTRCQAVRFFRWRVKYRKKSGRE